jgi:UPF0755 protein
MNQKSLEKLQEFTKIRDRSRFWIILTMFLFIFILTMTAPPANFQSGKIITIEKGDSIVKASNILKDNDIIQSRTMFSTLIILTGNHVIEGDYFFHKPINIFEVMNRISSGSYNIPTKQIVFYEGMTSVQIANSLKEIFPSVDATKFLELAEGKEGYLFPDTYIFPQNVTAETVFENMINNFEKQIEEHSGIIESSPFSLEEIVIMASIVEREATHDTRQEVADVLWKRIEIGMALQVDAPFVYTLGKGSFDLTKAELADENDPYNTYVNTGLTPTPIANPGIDSILAAAQPRDTEYLYFLTGYDGHMYFAEDFEGHKRNRELYLY